MMARWWAALLCALAPRASALVAPRGTVAAALTTRSALVAFRGETVSVGSAPLVADLFLELGAGDRLAILGRNGAGKSAVANEIAGRCASRVVSFDAHRRLVRDEANAWNEFQGDLAAALRRPLDDRPVLSRATVASYLFPGARPAVEPLLGYEPKRYPRLSPPAVARGAPRDAPALAALEAAATSGAAADLLGRANLLAMRHDPIASLSTGEARKLLLVDFLLSDADILVLDEALDGVDAASRVDVAAALRDEGRAQVCVAHRSPAPVWNPNRFKIPST